MDYIWGGKIMGVKEMTTKKWEYNTLKTEKPLPLSFLLGNNTI